jgi:hypothetical protein
MDITTAIDVIESAPGFTENDTPVGKAWSVVLSYLGGARTDLAPVQPAEGEVTKLVAALRDPCIRPLLRERTRAAALLQHHQPPQPVAVGERLPGPEDCDAEGRLWVYQNASTTKYWLPHDALPTPTTPPEAES